MKLKTRHILTFKKKKNKKLKMKIKKKLKINIIRQQRDLVQQTNFGTKLDTLMY